MVQIRHKETSPAKFKYIILYSSKTEAEMVVERERERKRVTMDPIRKRQKGKLRNPERGIWRDPQI